MSIVRIWLCSFLWLIAAPLRLYIRRSPIERGKWRLSHGVLEPLLSLFPDGMTVLATVPGGRIPLFYTEDLGRRVLITGGFETAEINAVMSYATLGGGAADVGANVGMFTIPLAHKVGPNGIVLAFEPYPSNADRLRQNCVANGASSVVVHQLALMDRDGVVDLHLGMDPAYGSTTRVSPGKESGATISIPSRTFDNIWAESGRPRVSVVKIDVEGAELSVLSGSREFLISCAPTLLVETASPEAFDEVAGWLRNLGYAHHSRVGFEPWNHLFLADRRRSQ